MQNRMRVSSVAACLGATLALVWASGALGQAAPEKHWSAQWITGAGAAERSADTNATWEVEIEKGIETVRPKVNGYYAAEPGLRIDGEKFDWDASSAEQPRTGNWTKAVTLGRGALREERDAPNNWQLMSDPLPAMQMTEVPAGRVVRATGIGATTGFPRVGFAVAARGKGGGLIDKGQLTTGYPALTVREGARATDRLTYVQGL